MGSRHLLDNGGREEPFRQRAARGKVLNWAGAGSFEEMAKQLMGLKNRNPKSGKRLSSFILIAMESH